MTDSFERIQNAFADRYVIEAELGSGGMAIVYLATDPKLDRKVAIKVLRPELAAAMGIDRFVREVQLTSQLEHPNILAIHDAGEADGYLYYVMPLVDGDSLRDRLDRETQLPVEDALQIAKDVADALGHSHDKGIMHRDIKPENILLSDGRAIVVDFGIARAVTMAGGEKLTQTGMAIGTPAYMSPEQASAGTVDHRTDIYALGCVLYEMLAGEAPYTGPTAQAIIAKTFVDPIPSIRRVRDTVSEEIDAAITRALNKVPADRFAQASQFIEALEGSRTPARARVRRSRWRRWVASTAATLAIVLLGGYAFVSTRVGVFGLAQPITVVLATPTVAAGDSTLGLAIQVALQQALVESKRVTALPGDRVRRTLENMGRSPNVRLDSANALEVAERNGAGAVVLANVLTVGGAFQLSAQVLSPNGVLRAAATANAAGPNLLIGAIDSLARGLRRELGDRARDLEASRDLSRILTPSLEALRLWAEADAIYGAAAYDLFPQAEALAAQAFALDSNFATAQLTLMALRQVMDSDYLAPLERSVSMRDRLGSADQSSVNLMVQILDRRDPRATLEILDPIAKQLELPGLVQIFFSDFTRDELAANGIWVTHLRALANGELGDRNREIELYDPILRDLDVLPYASILPVVLHNLAVALAAVGDRAGAERMLEARRERYGSAPDVQVAIAGQEWDRAVRVIRELHEGPDVSAKAPYELALLGTVEAVRGRPTESRAAFARALEAARQMNQPDLERIVRYRRAEAEFFALDDAGRAATIVAAMLAEPPSTEGMRRRLGAQAQSLAAAICTLRGSVGEEPPVAGLCDARAPVDSVRDEIEALELMQWSAVREGRLDDAARIGSAPALVNAGAPRLHARLPSAIAFERMGQPDSAAAVYLEILGKTPATLINHVPASLVRQSFVLRRLVALGGAEAASALERLQHDWAEAEPEFQRRVIAPVLSR